MFKKVFFTFTIVFALTILTQITIMPAIAGDDPVNSGDILSPIPAVNLVSSKNTNQVNDNTAPTAGVVRDIKIKNYYDDSRAKAIETTRLTEIGLIFFFFGILLLHLSQPFSWYPNIFTKQRIIVYMPFSQMQT